MSDRYYLNNMSSSAINLTLSTKRVIQPYTSLPLNNKDVAMFKAMKAARRGKPSMLDNVRLSKIRIEDDANYTALTGRERPVEELKDAENKKEDKSKENKKDDKKEEDKSKENKKAEDKVKETAEDLAKKALEKGLDSQFI